MGMVHLPFRSSARAFGGLALAALLAAQPLGAAPDARGLPMADTAPLAAGRGAAPARMPPAAPLHARPRPRTSERRCTADGQHCIGTLSYSADVCRLIAVAAERAQIAPDFLARLLWRESLFDAAAVSPAGAQGIAQFMPGTAALRNLDDPFNPAEAIFASADYLAELSRSFGGDGLAAAAYNAGERRLADFLAGARGLPGETRAYVSAITGHSGETWRDAPPEKVDYRLDPSRPFDPACRSLAAGRMVRTLRDPEPPWGVIIAAGTRRPTVERFAKEVNSAHRDLLSGHEMRIVEAVIPGMGTRPRLTAQLAAATRGEALELCKTLRRRKVFCRVNRN